MRSLFIFPAGGNAAEALDSIDQSNYEFKGFIDDDSTKYNSNYLSYPVYPKNILFENEESFLSALPGSPTSFKLRKSIIDSLHQNSSKFINIIDRNARISPSSKIGINCFIGPGVIVGPNVIIGDHVIILPNSIIHHDSKIDSYTCICSGTIIAGHVIVNENCYLGAGTIVKNNIELATMTQTGIGAVVINSNFTSEILVGVPAKNISR